MSEEAAMMQVTFSGATNSLGAYRAIDGLVGVLVDAAVRAKKIPHEKRHYAKAMLFDAVVEAIEGCELSWKAEAPEEHGAAVKGEQGCGKSF